MTGKPYAFADVAADDFPLTLRAYLVSSGRLVWTAWVPGPAALEIPPLAEQHGEPVRVEVEVASGEIVRAGP